MLVLAYCAGLRIGELARLNLGDVDLQSGTITIRETKFFKSRVLPLTDSALSALREYLEARRQAKAPQSPDSGLFWHDQGNARYTRQSIALRLIDILRRAGIKPPKGKIGPRIHDLRHSMVVNRILEWYRSRHQSAGQASVPGDLSRAPRYPFDAGLYHGHAGAPAASKRALPCVRGTLPACNGRGHSHEAGRPVSQAAACLLLRVDGSAAECFCPYRSLVP